LPKDTFFNLPEEKREALLDIIIEEFSENDYKNVSISRIVKRAGIAKGSFYQYFEDKKDLYLYLIELAAQEKNDFINGHPPPDPDMPIFDYFRWMYGVGVKFRFQNARMAMISYRSVYGDAPLPEETIKVIEEGNNQLFEGLIAKGKADGHIREDVEPEMVAFFFNAIFNNLGDYMLKRLGIAPEDLMNNVGLLETPEGEALFASAIDFMERGIGTKNE
jgi:AcrR family transcriptional regulator